jgi:hypothetical protein
MAASAWSGVGKAVMLFSASIVKVVIIVLLGAALCAVMDIHHSDLLEKQGNSAALSTMAKGWRWPLRTGQMIAGDRR